MTNEQYITLRLERIESALASKSIVALADQVDRRIVIMPRITEGQSDPAIIQERIRSAPSITLSDAELLSDEYLDIAVRRAIGLLSLAARAG